MQLRIVTHVKQPVEKVAEGFDQQLFRKLNPPFPPVSVLRFDGCRTGDLVELMLHFPFKKIRWVSKIVSFRQSEQIFEFIDRGIELPFFLSYWEHQHRIEKVNGTSRIIDHIHFKGNPVWSTYLLWPLLYLQFLYRKPVYKKWFS